MVTCRRWLGDSSTPYESRSLLRAFTWFIRRVFNAFVALVLIGIGLPLFLGIALLILALDGRPVIHRGKRLGLHKRPYTMYKFRTLARNATRVLGADLVCFRHRVVIPCGRFLRDTRLDELPQLFNILRGHMNFFGPRPERPEVYEALCRHLEDYDSRFSIKPGLVGYAQLFTPHSSPKRLRTLADKLAMGRATHPFREAFLVAYAVATVTKAATRWVLHYSWNDLLRSRILRLYRDRRECVRLQPLNARVVIEVDESRTIEAPLIDINGEALLFQCPERLPEGFEPLRLRIEMRFRRRLEIASKRMRTARCSGQVLQTRAAPEGCRHVIVYRPVTEWNQYLIHQYLLRGSLASPFNSSGDGRIEQRSVSEGTTARVALSTVAAGRGQ